MADGIPENGSRHHFFLNVKYAQVKKPDMTKQLVSGHQSGYMLSKRQKAMMGQILQLSVVIGLLGNSDYLGSSLIPKYFNITILSFLQD